MKYPDDRVPLLSGGPLKSKYQFEQLHFHWGLKNNEGSEHTINKRASAMEMHVLFRNTKYDSVAEATSFRDGLSVLGFLFEVCCTVIWYLNFMANKLQPFFHPRRSQKLTKWAS